LPFLEVSKKNTDQTNANSRGHTRYVSKVHAMLQDVAEASAKATIEKAMAVLKMRKNEEKHALEAVNSAINKLEVDREENSASDASLR